MLALGVLRCQQELLMVPVKCGYLKVGRENVWGCL